VAKRSIGWQLSRKPRTVPHHLAAADARLGNRRHKLKV
jgi:hypothetical protein